MTTPLVIRFTVRGGVFRWAADTSSTWDASFTCCKASEAKRFSSRDAAEDWLSAREFTERLPEPYTAVAILPAAVLASHPLREPSVHAYRAALNSLPAEQLQPEAIVARAKRVKGNFTFCVHQYPSGRFGYVGSIPPEIAYRLPAEGKFDGNISSVFNTERDAVLVALLAGWKPHQAPDCHYYSDDEFIAFLKSDDAPAK